MYSAHINAGIFTLSINATAFFQNWWPEFGRTIRGETDGEYPEFDQHPEHGECDAGESMSGHFHRQGLMLRISVPLQNPDLTSAILKPTWGRRR
jgi:hypothetical protein